MMHSDVNVTYEERLAFVLPLIDIPDMLGISLMSDGLNAMTVATLLLNPILVFTAGQCITIAVYARAARVKSMRNTLPVLYR